ncbi:MAG: hypothetical protein K2K54_04870 [Lachnospiraceae bacterium]|nr:hypothetical protein [Lachnospiraceae bacterium]
MIISLFINLLNIIYQHLPDSFIQNPAFIDKEAFQYFADFLPFLNWFVPFDLALYVMVTWLPCILIYYMVSSARTIIKKLLRMFVDRL